MLCEPLSYECINSALITFSYLERCFECVCVSYTKKSVLFNDIYDIYVLECQGLEKKTHSLLLINIIALRAK